MMKGMMKGKGKSKEAVEGLALMMKGKGMSKGGLGSPGPPTTVVQYYVLWRDQITQLQVNRMSPIEVPGAALKNNLFIRSGLGTHF